MDSSTMAAPHKEAASIIKNKSVMSRNVFYGLLPELRAKAFAISGVEAATVLQKTRDAIAGLAAGVDADGSALTWETQKLEVLDELEPFLGEGAEQRATLLLRAHGFQAFQTHNYDVAMEDEDTTHLQYLATEDDKVRDTHLALNGLVLPKNDPFWDTHTPPWEWNCRCRIRAMNPDLVALEKDADTMRNPEDRNVVEGAAVEQLRQGTLLREGRRYDVTSPSDKPQGAAATYSWHPDDLRMRADDLAARYDPEVWERFTKWAKRNSVRKDLSVWDWMTGAPKTRRDRMASGRIARRTDEMKRYGADLQD